MLIVKKEKEKRALPQSGKKVETLRGLVVVARTLRRPSTFLFRFFFSTCESSLVSLFRATQKPGTSVTTHSSSWCSEAFLCEGRQAAWRRNDERKKNVQGKGQAFSAFARFLATCSPRPRLSFLRYFLFFPAWEKEVGCHLHPTRFEFPSEDPEAPAFDLLLIKRREKT